MINKLIILIILILTPSSFAKLETAQDEGVSRLLFPFKEVCQYFGVKDALLIDKVGAKKIDCMGRQFPIEKFCLSKFKNDKTYGKARFDIVEPKLACHFMQTSVVTVACDKKHSDYCKRPKQGCLKLKGDFAYNLSLVRHALMESFPPKLKCYFSASTKIDTSL